MKKVLIISSEFPPEPGGIGNHAYNLSRQLSDNGFDVTVISDQRASKNIENKYDEQLNFKVKRVPLKSNRILMYFHRLFLIFNSMKSKDIVIASGKFPLWIAAFLTLFYKRNYIAVIHGTEVNYKNKFLRSSIDYSLKRFDTIIAVSNFTKSLISHLNLSNVKVINNGFELLDNRKIDAIEVKGSPSLITVGTVSARKGQLNVIKALPTLIDSFPNIHYHVVGLPNEKEEFLKFANSISVEDYITFHGAVENSKKVSLIKNSDVFSMLSQNTESGDVEGFGIAILEANSLGKPAIGAKNCGISDAINDYKSGILIDNQNPKEFLNALNHILNNYKSYEESSVDWASRFTWDKIINEYINTFKV